MLASGAHLSMWTFIWHLASVFMPLCSHMSRSRKTAERVMCGHIGLLAHGCRALLPYASERCGHDRGKSSANATRHTQVVG